MKQVIIIHGGKSLREEWLCNGFFDKIKGQEIWTTNFSYLTMPYAPTRLFWVDARVYRCYVQEFMELQKLGTQFTTKINAMPYARIGMLPNEKAFQRYVEVYPTNRDLKIANEREQLWIGRHSLCGFFALVVATLEDWDEIYLCGADYGTRGIDDTDTHYYKSFIDIDRKVPPKEQGFEGIGNPVPYHQEDVKDWVEDYEYFVEKNCDRIFNVTNPRYESNIPYFKKIDYQEMYKKLGIDNAGQ